MEAHGERHAHPGGDRPEHRSELAFGRGARLGRERAATVDLLHVVEGGLLAQVQERRRALAKEYLRQWFESLPKTERRGVRLNVEPGTRLRSSSTRRKSETPT
jgi:hypothetical protein